MLGVPSRALGLVPGVARLPGLKKLASKNSGLGLSGSPTRESLLCPPFGKGWVRRAQASGAGLSQIICRSLGAPGPDHRGRVELDSARPSSHLRTNSDHGWGPANLTWASWHLGQCVSVPSAGGDDSIPLHFPTPHPLKAYF